MTGIALSLVPLIVVIVVANGLIQGITYRLIEVFTYHLSAQLPYTSENTESAIREINALPSVVHAHLEKSSFGLVKAGSSSSGTTVKAIQTAVLDTDKGFRENLNLSAGCFCLDAIPPVLAANVLEEKLIPRAADPALLTACYTQDPASGLYNLNTEITPENNAALRALFDELKYAPVIIGTALAEKLEAGIGEQVFLLSVKGLNNKKIPKSSRFIITGIFSTGYQDVDKYLLYIPYSAGQKILAVENSREYIGIKVQDPFGDMSATIADVKKILRSNNISFSFVETWYNKQWTQFQSFKSTKTSLIFIICLIILVAAVNVYSSIHMLVMSKAHEIAIIRSMGALPGTITLSFVLTGLLTGLIGTFIGISSGLFLAVNINEFMAIIEQIINGVMAVLARIPQLDIENLAPVKILNPVFRY